MDDASVLQNWSLDITNFSQNSKFSAFHKTAKVPFLLSSKATFKTYEKPRDSCVQQGIVLDESMKIYRAVEPSTKSRKQQIMMLILYSDQINKHPYTFRP